MNVDNGSQAEEPWVTLAEVYHAYRKAKKEAFYDTNCPYGFKFAVFEEDLVQNLAKIFALVNGTDHTWATDREFIGKVTYVPRSLESCQSPSESHFFESDPTENWKRACSTRSIDKKPLASFRKVIHADVRYLVVSAIWVLKIGERFERTLRPECVYGNRIRRRLPSNMDDSKSNLGDVNWDSHSLFRSYQYQYGLWRQESITATRVDLETGKQILALCLDVSSFYDRIDPSFIADAEYHSTTMVELSEPELRLTKALLNSFSTWYDIADVRDRRGVPIGLPASAVIANLLLGELDNALVEQLRPTFYGRYVDDIYISLITQRSFADSAEAIKWIVQQVSILALGESDGLMEANLRCSPRSQIIFGARKQRIFHLKSKAGLDVIQPIEAHIREQSSEHRLLPTIPDDEAGMAAKAVLVSQDASKRVAVMRDADEMTLQRAGFADLLSNFERFERHLSSADWGSKREEFYGLVQRHILSPLGLFEFHRYIPRIVGLMASARDWESLSRHLDRLSDTKLLIEDTCRVDRSELNQAFANMGRRIELAVLMAVPAVRQGDSHRLRGAIRKIRRLGEVENVNPTQSTLSRASSRLVDADWSRQPFYDRLLGQNWSNMRAMPRLAKTVYQSLHIGDIRHLLKGIDNPSDLCVENWKAVVFPTRPIPLSRITEVLGHESCVDKLFDYALAMRGVRLPNWARPVAYYDDADVERKDVAGVMVGAARARKVLIGVSSFETTDEQWKYAVRGKPVVDLERLERFTHFLNSILRCRPRPEIIVLPELSLPRCLARDIGYWLNRNGVSLIGGLEYGTSLVDSSYRLNEVIVSMAVTPGYGPLCFVQRKNAPAWDEATELKRIANAQLLCPSAKKPEVPVYGINGFLFGILICSDLTNVRHRARYQGAIDALFVPEWNRDVNSFSSLVESSALDIHSFIIQSNNRKYGDSRIRAPYKSEYMRDVVRLKGGVHDYFVVGEIDFDALREYQSDKFPEVSEDSKFKPFPIGFNISNLRRKVRP